MEQGGAIMTLSALFEKCLAAPYTHTPEGIDYAFHREGRHLYLYLEASDGVADWLRNLDFPAAAYRRDGRAVFYAHRGFLRAFRVLEPLLAEVIRDPTLAAVTTVGYSHGAAIAVLAHEYFWYHREDLRPCLLGYGFGSPRVLFGGGRRALAERFSHFSVIRNLDDLVTHLPPAALGYYHVGRLIEIGERGRYSRIDAHREESIARELARAGL